MSSALLGAIKDFKERWPVLYGFSLLLLVASGWLALVELTPTTGFTGIGVIIAGTVWSLALVEMNYRIGEDPRYE